MDYKYHVRLVASSISKAGMPYTKHYNLCSVRYSLAQPLFNFDCPMSIAVSGSGEWVHFRGHPFMTSTRRGEGVRLRWTHVDRGRGVKPHVDVHTEN